MSQCIVLTCKSKQDPNRTYHKFPNDPSRRKEWLKNLCKKNNEIKTLSVVCSKHFRAKDYYPGGKRLLVEAVPLLWLGKKKTDEVKKYKNNLPTKPQAKQNNQKQSDKLKKPNLHSSNKGKNSLCAKPVLSTTLKKNLKSQMSCKIMKNNIDSKPVKTLINSKGKPLPTIKNASAPHSPQQKNVNLNIISKKHMKTSRQKELFVNPEKNKTSDLKIILHHSTPLESKKLANKLERLPLSKHTTVFKEQPVKHQITSVSRNLSPKMKNGISKSKFTTSLESTNTSSISLTPVNKTTNNKVNATVTSALTSNTKIPSKSSQQLTSKTQMLHKTQKPVSKVNPKSNAKSLKRKLNESDENKKEVKRSRFMPYNLPLYKPQKSSSSLQKPQATSHMLRNGLKLNNKAKNNLTNIEQTIIEMQNKIEKLEKKSILDEKKIDTFKKALIQQRQNDIKILMDEKENELLLRMDLLYLDYDPQRICRLCLLLVDKKESLTSLVRSPKNEALILLIKNTTNVQIQLEDGMPTSICSECLQQLKKIDWIKRRIQRSNMLIKKFLTMKKALNDEGGPSPTPLCSSKNEKFQFSDDLFEEEISGAFKIEDVFSLENSPEILPFENMPIKIEPETGQDVIRLSVNEDIPIVHSKAIIRRTYKCKECNTSFNKRWSLRNHYKFCSNKFQCSECKKCFWSNRLFVMHKLRTQSCMCPESQRCCFDCQIVFRWKWQLVFHVFCHNPQTCQLCDEVVYSVAHLKQHVADQHMSITF